MRGINISDFFKMNCTIWPFSPLDALQATNCQFVTILQFSKLELLLSASFPSFLNAKYATNALTATNKPKAMGNFDCIALEQRKEDAMDFVIRKKIIDLK